MIRPVRIHFFRPATTTALASPIHHGDDRLGYFDVESRTSVGLELRMTAADSFAMEAICADRHTTRPRLAATKLFVEAQMLFDNFIGTLEAKNDDERFRLVVVIVLLPSAELLHVVFQLPASLANLRVLCRWQVGEPVRFRREIGFHFYPSS